ncbi:MAG: hypothetical protein KKA79_09545, partial [Nanoarchaeota archaeon]|nr:hypothetical protein [Nanoarchaeota archaeon]
NQFLVKYTESIGSKYIIRGIRTEVDYTFERSIGYINRDMSPDIITIFLMPPRELSEISSSLVKGLIGPEGWEEVVEPYISRPVYNKILEKYDGYFDNWCLLWEKLEVKGDPKKAYDKLRGLYCSKDRDYHNLVHIVHSLREFSKVKDLTYNQNLVETAIWFHDSIYDTQDRKKEEKSAKLSNNLLKKAGLPINFIEAVSDMILSTKHKVIPDNEDAKLLVDIDLAILGKSEDEFNEYEKDIRDEYDWLDDDNFKKGRKEFVEGMLKRDYIYCTDVFKEKYENQAQINLKQSLNRL